MSELVQSPTWQALRGQAAAMKKRSLRGMFEDDPKRFERFSLRLDDLLLDCSKNLIDESVMALLLHLARDAEVEAWRERMFKGEAINTTEGRAVLHTALRNRANTPVYVDGENVMPGVNAVLERMRDFVAAVRDGTWRGHTGQAMTDIVNIGIGGSDLGAAHGLHGAATLCARDPARPLRLERGRGAT